MFQLLIMKETIYGLLVLISIFTLLKILLSHFILTLVMLAFSFSYIISNIYLYLRYALLNRDTSYRSWHFTIDLKTYRSISFLLNLYTICIYITSAVATPAYGWIRFGHMENWMTWSTALIGQFGAILVFILNDKFIRRAFDERDSLKLPVTPATVLYNNYYLQRTQQDILESLSKIPMFTNYISIICSALILTAAATMLTVYYMEEWVVILILFLAGLLLMNVYYSWIFTGIRKYRFQFRGYYSSTEAEKIERRYYGRRGGRS